MIKLLSVDSDSRLKAHCVTARCTYRWFINIVRGAERNLEIQREIIKGTKAYATLREDLKRGCVIPPIILAVKGLTIPTDIFSTFEPIDTELENQVLEELIDPIGTISSEKVYIIDGLQRTNAIVKVLEGLERPERDRFLSNHLRVEFWLNIPFGAVAYKMLLLNAGQRPMSIKNQVEILSMKLLEELSTVRQIEIFTSIGGGRRTRPGQFQLSKLAQAFQAWLQGQPNLDLRNTIMEQLLAESAIETLGQSLSGERNDGDTDAFKQLVQWIVDIDYALTDENKDFFGNETVLLGIAAAVGAAEKNPQIRERMQEGLLRLKTESLARDVTQTPLAISVFNDLKKGINAKRINIGVATREMVFGAFQEYFYSGGMKAMEDCWRFAAGRM